MVVEMSLQIWVIVSIKVDSGKKLGLLAYGIYNYYYITYTCQWLKLQNWLNWPTSYQIHKINSIIKHILHAFLPWNILSQKHSTLTFLEILVIKDQHLISEPMAWKWYLEFQSLWSYYIWVVPLKVVSK